MDCFIGLDIGTSSVKGMLLSEKAIVKLRQESIPSIIPKTLERAKSAGLV